MHIGDIMTFRHRECAYASPGCEPTGMHGKEKPLMKVGNTCMLELDVIDDVTPRVLRAKR